MAKNKFISFPMNQIFWLNGNQCVKVGSMSYALLGQASYGEFPIQPHEAEQVSIEKPKADNVVADKKRKVQDLFIKYRIPFTLLGEAGFKELVTIFTPPPVAIKVPLKVTKPKKAVKPAKAVVKSAPKKGK